MVCVYQLLQLAINNNTMTLRHNLAYLAKLMAVFHVQIPLHAPNSAIPIVHRALICIIIALLVLKTTHYKISSA
jgi:hypothetical protein